MTTSNKMRNNNQVFLFLFYRVKVKLVKDSDYDEVDGIFPSKSSKSSKSSERHVARITKDDKSIIYQLPTILTQIGNSERTWPERNTVGGFEFKAMEHLLECGRENGAIEFKKVDRNKLIPICLVDLFSQENEPDFFRIIAENVSEDSLEVIKGDLNILMTILFFIYSRILGRLCSIECLEYAYTKSLTFLKTKAAVDNDQLTKITMAFGKKYEL